MKHFLIWPIILLFSFWLMWHTFSYDYKNSQLLIASKVWSDFGNHIPLIRSFTFGQNWPVQLPIFPGEKIRYHYLFYAVSGQLENWGLNISWALNLPSALSFFSLVFLIFLTARQLFSNRQVGFLTVLFFLFNGSFSFIDYFNHRGWSLSSVLGIVSNHQFASFGPWDKGIISAFWNLNIYTNQRHLALGFAISLLVIYAFVSHRKNLQLLTGFLIGSLLLLNQAAFLITLIFLFFIFIFQPQNRRCLTFSLMGFIPWLVLALATLNFSGRPVFQPGYLSSVPFFSWEFITYWFYNLGLHFLLIPLGVLLSPSSIRKYFLPLLILFILGNTLRFSPDMINNHKFFNFFLILGSMYSAHILIKILKIKFIGLFLFFTLTLVLTFGGLIDIFPIKNDYFISIKDYSSDPVAAYIARHLPPRAVFLNSNWLYQSPSLVGRPIYNGYSYFTWSYGYDQISREANTALIFSSYDLPIACHRLKSAGISYILLNRQPESFIKPDWSLWNNQFIPEFTDPVTGSRIFSVTRNCADYEN